MVNPNQQNEREVNSLIRTAVEAVKDEVSPDVLPMIEEALLKIEKENLTPAQALGVSPDLIEDLYENAYYYFQSGKFKEALEVFKLLTQMVGGADPRFIFATAATHHHMKNYVDAGGYYMLYAALKPQDPLPYYHLYDCFKKTNNPEFAINALVKADELAGKEARWAQLKGKIEVELRQLSALENAQHTEKNA